MLERSPTPRHQRLFLGAYALIACALIWPVYGLAAHPQPLILGLPPALAWLVACILLLFLALCGLYVADRRAEKPDDRGRG